MTPLFYENDPPPISETTDNHSMSCMCNDKTKIIDHEWRQVALERKIETIERKWSQCASFMRACCIEMNCSTWNPHNAFLLPSAQYWKVPATCYGQIDLIRLGAFYNDFRKRWWWRCDKRIILPKRNDLSNWFLRIHIWRERRIWAHVTHQERAGAWFYKPLNYYIMKTIHHRKIDNLN